MKALELAWQNFRDTQEKYSGEGACDTEPDWVFEDIIRKLLEGREFEIPTTASGWQLYSGMSSSDTGARELGNAAEKVVEALRQKLHNRMAVSWVLDQLWRVDVNLPAGVCS